MLVETLNPAEAALSIRHLVQLEASVTISIIQRGSLDSRFVFPCESPWGPIFKKIWSQTYDKNHKIVVKIMLRHS